MFRRAAFLVFSLHLSISMAQVSIESGEINLRGTLIVSKLSDARVVLNPGTRGLKTLNLVGADLKKLLDGYKSGTKVEICAEVKPENKKSNQDAELSKIRPLAPNEAILTYNGKLKGCPKTKGCKQFGKEIESAFSSDQINFADGDVDYFSCQK